LFFSLYRNGFIWQFFFLIFFQGFFWYAKNLGDGREAIMPKLLSGAYCIDLDYGNLKTLFLLLYDVFDEIILIDFAV
jgi:hypothetical protein